MNTSTLSKPGRVKKKQKLRGLDHGNYLKNKKYPPDENLAVEVVPAALKSTHEGVKVLGIAEVKEGKL